MKADIKKPATGVVHTNFKVTKSGNVPRYNRFEVDRGKLDEHACYRSSQEGGSSEGHGASAQADAEQGAADRARRPLVGKTIFPTAEGLK